MICTRKQHNEIDRTNFFTKKGRYTGTCVSCGAINNTNKALVSHKDSNIALGFCNHCGEELLLEEYTLMSYERMTDLSIFG
jgi:hypothetical protein